MFHSIRSFNTVSLAVTVALATSAPAHARTQNVGGSWTVTVERFPMALTLVHDKQTITGALSWPHGAPIKLSGRFEGRTLTISGDSAGDNFTIHVDGRAVLKDDGTLDGAFKAHFVDFNDAHQAVREHNQDIPWTAQRTSVPSHGTGSHSAR